MQRRRTEIIETAAPIGEEWVTWIEGYPVGGERQARGRHYASSGAVTGMELLEGTVDAYVTGSGPEPYRIALEFVPIEAARWRSLWLAATAEDVQSFQKGVLTVGMREAFDSTGIRLFPERYKDLKTVCNCPDWMRPCKHALAALQVLGLEIGRDPMILVKLRGGEQEPTIGEVEERPEEGEQLRGEAKAFWGEGHEWAELQSKILAGGPAVRLLKRLGPVAVYGVRMDPDLMFKPVYDGVATEARLLMEAMRRKGES